MLTALEVKNAKAKAKPYKVTDGKGLFLHVSTNGKKTWRYRYELSGTESVFVIGEYPVITLEAARAERVSLRELVKAGINPAENRRQQKQAVQVAKEEEKQLAGSTFEAVALDWHHHQKDRWTEKHAEAVLVSLKKYVFLTLGAVQVDRITPPMVLEVIRTLESRGSLEIARKTLQRIAAVCRYAVQTGRATFNPAADMRGVLKAKKVQHHPMISPEDLPGFLRALSCGDIHTTTKHAIQFTILTAARSGEVRGATWVEVDLEKRLWVVPPERMKMRVSHIVPLSDQAVSILERQRFLHHGEGLVFPGIHNPHQQISENTMLYALYRVGYHSRATMHGFRALFSTVCNEAGFNPDAIEHALAHREKDAVRAAYHRAEYMTERANLLQWWADHLQRLEHGAEIIPFRLTVKGQEE